MKYILLVSLFISFGVTAQVVQINNNKKILYFMDYESGTVQTYDFANNTMTNVINLGFNGINTSYNEAKKELYISSTKSQYAVINTLDNTIRKGDVTKDGLIEGGLFAFGVSGEGVVLLSGKFKEVGDADMHQGYLFYDISDKQAKYKQMPNNGIHTFDGTAFYLYNEQTSILSAYNPNTLELKTTYNNLVDNVVIADLKAKTKDQKVSFNFIYFATTYPYVYLTAEGVLPNTKREKLNFLYDLVNRKILSSEDKLSSIVQHRMCPVYGCSAANPLYFKKVPKDERITEPIEPDVPVVNFDDKKKIKEIKNETERMKSEYAKYALASEEYLGKLKQYMNPNNFKYNIYTDIGCNNLIHSFPNAQYVSVTGGYLVVINDVNFELYDVVTHKLIYTVDRV